MSARVYAYLHARRSRTRYIERCRHGFIRASHGTRIARCVEYGPLGPPKRAFFVHGLPETPLAPQHPWSSRPPFRSRQISATHSPSNLSGFLPLWTEIALGTHHAKHGSSVLCRAVACLLPHPGDPNATAVNQPPCPHGTNIINTHAPRARVRNRTADGSISTVYFSPCSQFTRANLRRSAFSLFVGVGIAGYAARHMRTTSVFNHGQCPATYCYIFIGGSSEFV